MTFRTYAPNSSPPTICTLNADECAHVAGGSGKYTYKSYQSSGGKMTVRI